MDYEFTVNAYLKFIAKTISMVKLSIPGENDIIEDLDGEYYKVLGQLKKLKNK